jgi:hypothetical protein
MRWPFSSFRRLSSQQLQNNLMTDATTTSKFSGTKVLTVFLSVSSAAAIVLALLGYGVALSAEAVVGIPHAVIFNSTTDLLTLGGWAVLQMLNYLSKLSEWGFYAGVWKMTWPATKIALGVVAGVIAVAGAVFGAQALLRRWKWLGKKVEKARSVASAHRRLVVFAAVPFFALGTPLVVMPLMMIAVLVGLVLLTCVLSIVPIAGLQAGTVHINDWVIGPAICAPLKSREVRLQRQLTPQKDGGTKVRAATCVTVRKSGGTEYRGRVVFATFNAVVLYDPAAGSVRRVSTEDASVEVIDQL